MKNWMSMMAMSAVANSTFLLLPTIPLKTIIPFSLTKTSPFLISLTTPSRRYLSASALPFISTDHDFNFSDSSGDGNGVAVSRKSSKVLLKGMTYSELESPNVTSTWKLSLDVR
ncbi:dual-specificity RNA methyltransferase RlmN-like [Trifolium medium]|uniref:Dual-specificity RNA methyltransferase RlmN-like n=1 Tax=Trifolium medium TaxID=97028 RepID=A0A392NER4_9FABA|nr:dual-specificity RNA methyltransferase RlmN-like [Trifolium medium]